jgi:tetratricopeptide (TPR) repeat protein
MKRFVNHKIGIIGIVVLIFFMVANTVTAGGKGESRPSAIDKIKADQFYQKGAESYKKRNYDQAITEFTEAIRLNPNDTHAYNARGVAYQAKRLYDQAIADYDQAIQLDSKNAMPYNNRARINAYYLQRDFNSAISDANKAVSLSPNDAIYLDTRGWANLGIGDYDKAIADFEKALQIDSSRKTSTDGLARARDGLAKARVSQAPQTQAPQIQTPQQIDLTPQTVKDEDFEVKQNTDNTLTITGYKGTARNVVIPDTLYGLKVTIIGKEAFLQKGIISVVIPDTVTSIERGYSYTYAFTEYVSGAFSNNPTLTKLTLGKGLKTIGMCAFMETGLTEVIIPDSVTVIEDAAFLSSKLVKVTLGTGLQTIGSRAFRNNQITELTIPPSLKEISEAAFYNNKIQELTLGSGLKIIGRAAFSSNKIQKLTLGTGLETIGSEAFKDNQITELNFTLPSSLKSIAGGTFANNQIQSIIIPNGITSINNSSYDANGFGSYTGAFENNPLTTVFIPTSLGNGIAGQSFGKIDGNTIVRITIPAGMNEGTLKSIFEEAFVNFWISQNKTGGTYVKRGPIWTKE